jgi:hypothetical protein
VNGEKEQSMRKFRVLLGLLCVALFAVACGPAEPLVQAKAADINMTVADLGEGFTLTEESDLLAILARTKIKAEDKAPLEDANRRIFVGTAVVTATGTTTVTAPLTRTEVIATLMVYNASGGAQAGLTETRDGFKGVLPPTMTLVAINTTTLGSASELWVTEAPNLAARVYVLLMRRDNVLAVIQVTGPSQIRETWVVGLAQKVLGRVPAATAK